MAAIGASLSCIVQSQMDMQDTVMIYMHVFKEEVELEFRS
jgi:hypothetical protein